MVELEQSILSQAERNEINRLAKKQENETAMLMDEINRLEKEK
jgi:hypothetical protein